MYLLDTHIIIWLLSCPDKLSTKAKQIIKNPNNKLYYSPLSFSEMAIKVSTGKLIMVDNWQTRYADLLTQKQIYPIHQTWADSQILQTLPFHHKDPFDRMLISLAMVNKLSFISADGHCANYDLQVIW